MNENVGRLRLAFLRIGWFIKKFKYVLLVIVLVAAGVIVWQVRQAAGEARWTRAADHFAKADYEAAAKELEGVDIPRDNVDRLNIYAQSMLATKQLDKAMAGYQALYEQKNDPFAKMVIGNIYNEQQKPEEAIRTYNELIEANPAYTQAYVNLAMLYRVQGNNQDALAVAKKGQQNNSNNTVLAELLVSLTMNDPESEDHRQAVETLRKLDPNNRLLEQLN